MEALKKHGHMIIWGIVIVLIIILAITGSGDRNTDDAAEEVSEDTTEEVATVDSSTVAMMEPYAEGPHVYTFSGVTWEVTSGDTDVTAIAMRLDDFSRWENKSPVNLRRPFWVGTYTGDCESASSTGISVDGQVVGALTCDSGVEVAVVQDAAMPNLVHVYDFADGETGLVRTIDMTTLVQ